MSKQILIGTGGANHKSKPFVGVGGVVKKVKAVFAGISGVVKKLWSSAFVLYDNGVEYVSIVQGLNISYDNASSYYVERSNYIDIYTFGGEDDSGKKKTSYSSTVTENPIDLTNYSTIYVDMYTPPNTWYSSEMFVGPSKDLNNGIAYASESMGFGRAVKSLDISSITGELYIHVAVDAYGSADQSSAYVYKIWLE